MKVKNCKICKNIFSQGLGLMFSRPKNIVFAFDKEKRSGIHSFFVFFSIDLIFLDKNKKIIEIKKNLKPFSYYKPSKKAKYILEIPSKDRSKVSVGDQLNFYTTS